MTGFHADWLALREDADARSRDPALAQELRVWLRRREPLRVLDLATGTGANARYLAPLLGGRQEWLLVDHDPELLDRLPGAMRAWAAARGLGFEARPRRPLRIAGRGFQAEMRPLALDLMSGIDRLPSLDRHLITASALLDLVSATWLETLAGRCRAAGAAVLFALTFDGGIDFRPAEPEDEMLRGLMIRHQRGDKGFGSALGPAAAHRAPVLFAANGYETRRGESGWVLGTKERAMQAALLEDWVAAAKQVAPEQALLIDDWQRRRLAHVERGVGRLRVGHLDVLALPAGARR